MPLAGGRGIQDNLNGEMDSIAQRVTSDYRANPRKQIFWSGTDVSVVGNTANITPALGIGFPYLAMVQMPQLDNVISVARASVRSSINPSVSDTTGASVINFCLYEFNKDQRKFKRIDESQFSITFGIPGVTGIQPTIWYQKSYSDIEKYTVTPDKDYFLAVQLPASVNGTTNFSITAVRPAEIGKDFKTHLATNDSVKGASFLSTYDVSDLSVNLNTDVIPNVIFSSQDGVSIYPWQ